MDDKNSIQLVFILILCIVFSATSLAAQENYTIDELIANADFLMRFKLSMELFYHNQLQPPIENPYYYFGLPEKEYLFFHIITSYSFIPEAKFVADLYFLNPNGIALDNPNFMLIGITKNLYFEHKISESLGITIMDIGYAFGFKSDALTLIPKSTYEPIIGAPPFIIRNTFISLHLAYQFIDLDYYAVHFEESPLLFLRLTFSVFEIFYTGITVAAYMDNGGNPHPYLEIYAPFGNGHFYSYFSLNKYLEDFVFAGGFNARFTLQFAENHALSLIGFGEYIDPNCTVFEGFEILIEDSYANDPLLVNYLSFKNVARIGLGLSYFTGLFDNAIQITTAFHLYAIILNRATINNDKIGGTAYAEILFTYFYIRGLAQYFDLINYANDGIMIEIGFKTTL